MLRVDLNFWYIREEALENCTYSVHWYISAFGRNVEKYLMGTIFSVIACVDVS